MNVQTTEIRQNGYLFTFVEAAGQIEVYGEASTGASLLVTYGRDEFFARAEEPANVFDLNDGERRLTLYSSTMRAAANRIRVRDAQIGDFLSATLVTDTMVYEVVGRTEKTLKIRACERGEIVKRENRDGNPWPVVWTEALSWENGTVQIVRRRKDGTYRTFEGANPLRPAARIDGKPVSYTDYRE